jgi:hypothetical protein
VKVRTHTRGGLGAAGGAHRRDPSVCVLSMQIRARERDEEGSRGAEERKELNRYDLSGAVVGNSFEKPVALGKAATKISHLVSV